MAELESLKGVEELCDEDLESEGSTTGCFKWKPTSEQHLIKAESCMLKVVKCPLKKLYVDLPSGERLWTVIANPDVNDKIPLVMLHGFGGGIGFWAMNYEALSKDRPVYTFDLLGFGRSSRPKFNDSPEEAEEIFIQSIEDWRKSVKINKMILLGHSFGGYLASLYALKYPKRVTSLILADPWGFPVPKPEDLERLPWWIKLILRCVEPFNPLAIIRCCGPVGPRLIKRSRRDFKQRFPEVTEQNKNAVTEYIYHCNAGRPSGESAFKQLNQHVGYAVNPMINRIDKLDANIPVTFIYGAKSWMDRSSGEIVKDLIPNKVTIHVLEGEVGHHVYADDPDHFNGHVLDTCNEADGTSLDVCNN
uniref:Abhydrolase domain-containing protein 4 n=1 Tax=Phallusia mammillata TaxID=59560 RepID=A0A6F9D509_9ASCI|nr:abhydrolase domain-containing protein 4 [Phallusia mammillata]